MLEVLRVAGLWLIGSALIALVWAILRRGPRL